MSDAQSVHREFSTISVDLPVLVQQGGSEWPQRLRSLSLTGVETDQPQRWDAQYNEPFTLLIDTGASEPLELHAWLQDVAGGLLSFNVEHVDRENIHPLSKLLRQHLNDDERLEEELQRLEAEYREDTPETED